MGLHTVNESNKRIEMLCVKYVYFWNLIKSEVRKGIFCYLFLNVLGSIGQYCDKRKMAAWSQKRNRQIYDFVQCNVYISRGQTEREAIIK